MQTDGYLLIYSKGDVALKKGIRWLCGILVAIALTFSLLSFQIDSKRVDIGEKPLFCLRKDSFDDGGTVAYYGLGYQIIRYHKLGDDPGNVNAYYYGVEKHYGIGMIDLIHSNPTITLELRDKAAIPGG